MFALTIWDDTSHLECAWALHGKKELQHGEISAVAIFWLWPRCLVRKRLGVAHSRLLLKISWRERRDLFPEGVASRDPDSNSVLLWTRRAPQPNPAQELVVEVALDQTFQRVIATQRGSISAEADWTCRVLVGGLQPAQVYWYRFTDPEGSGRRPGRTITAPADDDSRPVHFAFVSCQNANFGAQNAYEE